MTQYRRLPLASPLNTRELGGHPIPGGATRFGVFLRAAVPSMTTQADKDFLRRYGVTLDIDLRSAKEIDEWPDLLAGESWLRYRHIPMPTRPGIAASEPGNWDSAFESSFSWGEQYIRMAENAKPWLRAVLEALAAAEGVSLYHCTTGKDRTGIVSALLLGLCGVSAEDIVDDYCVSQCHLGPLFDFMLESFPAAKGSSMDAPFFTTAPRSMETLLAHFEREYGGVPGFVEACGLPRDARQLLTSRLAGGK